MLKQILVQAALLAGPKKTLICEIKRDFKGQARLASGGILGPGANDRRILPLTETTAFYKFTPRYWQKKLAENIIGRRLASFDWPTECYAWSMQQRNAGSERCEAERKEKMIAAVTTTVTDVRLHDGLTRLLCLRHPCPGINTHRITIQHKLNNHEVMRAQASAPAPVLASRAMNSNIVRTLLKLP